MFALARNDRTKRKVTRMFYGMNSFYNSFYNLSRVLSLAANFLGRGVVPLMSLAIYVFTALSLYTIAKRRGIACPWLAWIPVANLWLIGSLSDQYRYLTRGQIKHKRIVLLVLKAVTLAFTGGLIGSVIWLIGASGSPASVITLLIMVLLYGGAAIALAVVNFMALYDIYASCNPENATVYLVLTIFFRVLKPIFLFLSRNQDVGMPPRKAAPQQEARPEAQPEEPVGEPTQE